MNRSEIMEIRKLFSKYVEGDCAAGNIAGCVITHGKTIEGGFSTKFLKESKQSILKYFGIFKKTLPNALSEVQFSEKDKGKDGIQFLLDKINATNLENQPLLNELYRRLANALPEKGYAVILLQYEYDVPIKDKNKEKIKGAAGDGIYSSESEEVYRFTTCAVCPLQTEKETLGYDSKSKKNMVKNGFYSFGTPEFGYLFPTFNDRSTDKDHVACYETEKLNITKVIFGHDSEKAKEEPKETGIRKKAKKKEQEEPEWNDDAKTVEPDNTPAATSHGTRSATQNDSYAQADSASDSDTSNVDVEAGINMPRVGNRAVKITGDKNKISKRLIGGQEYFVVLVSDAYVD